MTDLREWGPFCQHPLCSQQSVADQRVVRYYTMELWVIKDDSSWLCTRGLSGSNSEHLDLWFNDPQFLWKSEFQ